MMISYMYVSTATLIVHKLLFVKVVFCVIFLDCFLVRLLKILGQYDVPVLPHSMHTSLEGGGEGLHSRNLSTVATV